MGKIKFLVSFLVRLFGGVDMSIGVQIYVCVSLAFEQRFSWLYFLLTLAAAHAPDFDLLPYFFLKKRLKYPSHWTVGHHPIIVIPLAGFVGWVVGAGSMSPWYGFTLAVTAVFLHFVHDSIQPQGLHWLSPFTWRSVSLMGLSPHLVPEEVRIADLEALRSRIANNGGEILARMPQISVPEASMCGASWVVLAVWLSL